MIFVIFRNMIASLKAQLLTGLILCLSINSFASLFNTNQHHSSPADKKTNQFLQIALDHNICPPDLEYGYPIWYNWNKAPIKGIVYLTNKMEHLEKLDGRTYVGPPTLENAEVIANFSGPTDFASKYYLVVDTSVAQYEMNAFIEQLGDKELEMEICFVGNTGRFVPLIYTNFENYLSCWEMPCIHIRNYTQIMVNGHDELLLESSFIQIGEVAPYFELHYAHNHGEDECLDCSIKTLLTEKDIISKIDRFESAEKEDNNKWLQAELTSLKRKLELAINYGPIYEMKYYALIDLKIQRNTSQKMFYNVLEQVQLGIFKARHNYAIKNWSVSYKEILAQQNKDLIDILDLIFPDRLHYEFNFPAPPPPVIEEIVLPEPE